MSVNAHTKVKYISRVLVVAIAGLAVQASQAAAAPSVTAQLTRASAARATSLAAGRILGGLTKQGAPVVVAVSRNGKRVSTLGVLAMQCSSGDRFLTEDAWSGLPVHRGGLVSASTAIRPVPGSASTAVITGGSRSVRGALNRKRAVFAGIWHLHLNFALANGQTDSCDSGNVLFAARL